MKISEAQAQILTILNDQIFAKRGLIAFSDDPEVKARLRKEVKQLEDTIKLMQKVFQFAIDNYAEFEKMLIMQDEI